MELKKNDTVKVLDGRSEIDVKVSELGIKQVMTVTEFQEKYGHQEVPKPTIYYQMDHTDRLDFIRIGDLKMIVKNKKAKNFKLSKTGRKRESTISM